MIKVYTVDGNTRVYLPETAYSAAILEHIKLNGHEVSEPASTTEELEDDREWSEVQRAAKLVRDADYARIASTPAA